MIWHELNLHPRDLLFFRDARPMAGGSAGRGDQWPLPQTLHGALLSSLLAHWPMPQPWEQPASAWKKSHARDSAPRFGELRSAGPFPCDESHLYIPTPRDLVPLQENDPKQVQIGFSPLQVPEGASSNLPSPLLYPVTRSAKPSKVAPHPWIRLDEFAKYLAGQPCETTPSDELMRRESSIGIGIDNETGTVKEGYLYTARKLRLAEGIHLRAFCALPAAELDGAPLDAWATGKPTLLLGGETASVRVFSQRRKTAEPFACLDQHCPPDTDPTCVKWTLLTPALFRHGWKPSWIDAQGQVQLTAAAKPQREPGETRAEWRARWNTGTRIQARLFSALVPSPRHASGWSLPHEGPKATQRHVEAGSVYYFKANTPEDAAQLRAALNGQARSDSLGEKGYGIGICSFWNFSPEIPA